MEYRSSKPTDNGFADEQEELDSMRGFVQTVMESDANSIMDTLLVCANVCENRALTLSIDNPKVSMWYKATSLMLRELLLIQSHGKEAPKPNQKLENDYLYFPDVEQSH